MAALKADVTQGRRGNHQAFITTIKEDITKEMEGKLEAKQSRWVEVVKWNIKEEVM